MGSTAIQRTLFGVFTHDNSLKLDYPPTVSNSDYLIDLYSMPISQNFYLKDINFGSGNQINFSVSFTIQRKLKW